MFIGTLIAGVVDAFLPAETMEKLLPRNMALAIAASGVLGVIFPMCECGVVPVIRRMILKGMPVSCGLTYLLAAPIVNPVVALSTFAAFRGQNPLLVASLRLSIGFIVAGLVGLVIERLPVDRILNREMLRMRAQRGVGRSVPKAAPEPALVLSGAGHDHGAHGEGAHAHEAAHRHHQTPRFAVKLVSAVRCAGFDFLDVGAYLIVGAALTSVFNTAVNQQIILPLASHAVVATGGMMLLALLLSLCSTSDAFIAANFATFPIFSKLAFMVFGPMMDLKLFFMYGLVFRKRFTASLALALFLLIGLICIILGVVTR